MKYYKVLNENGEIIGIAAGEGGVEDEFAVEITYEEYLEICEQLGISPR